MRSEAILSLFVISALFAFSYQGADAGMSGNQYVITDVDNNECEEIGTWDAGSKTCTLNGNLLTNDFISIQSNDITLDGNGWGLSGIGCNGIGVEVESGKSNATIKNISISGFRTGIYLNYVHDSKIINVDVTNNCNHGLEMRDGSEGNTISKSNFNSNGEENIYLNGSHDNKFTNVKANDGGDDGIQLDYSMNNVFNRIEANENEDEGLDLEDYSDGNSFTNSKFNDNDSSGIELESSHKNSFDNNDVNDNGNEGIELAYSHYNVFTLNDVNRNADSGFDIEDESANNQFSCNTVKNNGPDDENGTGFEIEHYSYNNEIFKNLVSGHSIGIGLYSEAMDNNIFNNNIINNDIQVYDDSGEDNNLSPNYWGGDVPEEDESPLNKAVDLSNCNQSAISECTMYAGMSRFGNGVPQDGSLAIVNENSGILNEVGPAAKEIEDLLNEEYGHIELGISGIAFNEAGKLYASVVGGIQGEGMGEGLTGLVKINPITGKITTNFEDIPFVTLVGGEYEHELKITDLAFHPKTDKLYGIARGEGDILVQINPVSGDATFVGYLMLDDEDYLRGGGLSFLSDGTMVVTGQNYGGDSYYNMYVIATYSSIVPVEDYLIADDWASLDEFYDGLGVSCDDEIYGTTAGEDSVHLITLFDGEGLEANETFVAGKNTNPGDVDFLFTPEPEPEPEQQDSNGGDNQWDTRPTFGISHETRQNQVVENGFSFNTEYFTLTDNHHTDFAEQSVEIGTVNSFSATVYADKKLKIQEFLFGIPNVGEAHLAELGVEVWYGTDGEIEDVIVVQKSDVIDAETVSVSHEKTKCLATDAEAKCDTTTVSMTFLEPLADKVMAIKAIDFKNRDQRTFLNEGFDISGESLNPMLAKLIPSNLRDQGLLKVTQMAKYSPYWTSEEGRMFEMNSFGSFKQINQSFERFQDTGNAFTRAHSAFGGILAYEQNRATDLFDSSELISELPESYAYIFPESGERVTDEMLQEMQLQAEIAQSILDEMDKQSRHY